MLHRWGEGEIWHGGVDLRLTLQVSTPPCQFSSPSVHGWAVGPQNRTFYAISEFKCPQGHIPCTIFTKISVFVGSFNLVKINI